MGWGGERRAGAGVWGAGVDSGDRMADWVGPQEGWWMITINNVHRSTEEDGVPVNVRTPADPRPSFHWSLQLVRQPDG